MSRRQDGCPEANLLAALAEGRLPEEERGPVEAHVAECTACRDVVAEVAAATSAPRRLLVRLTPWIAAAAVLVAGVAILLRGPRTPPDTRARLEAAARDVGFEPLRDEELAQRRAPTRGGFALHAPVGTVLDVGEFRWEAVAGAARYRLVLRGADGTPVWRGTSEEPRLAFRDALVPGEEYLWEVTVEGALGEETSRRLFTFASAEERRAWNDARDAIEAKVPGDLRDLVLAHRALRLGLLDEAEAAARRFAAAYPGDDLGAATMDYVQRVRDGE